MLLCKSAKVETDTRSGVR